MMPTDSEIMDLVVMHSGSIMPTYVYKNILRRRFPGVTTPWVLRRLKALEKAGRVCRRQTNYAKMICWDLPRARLGASNAKGADHG